MNEISESKIPCCPPLEPDGVCDVLDFHYRLKHNTEVVSGGRRVQVEVIIHARFERCPGPMTLGDLSYSTTFAAGRKSAPVYLGPAQPFQFRQRNPGELPQRANV